MLPADMGPTENPEDFLPSTIDESGLDELTLAVYKARSSASPFSKNRIVADNIVKRLVVAEGKEFKTNTLNNRDQRLRNNLGIFAEGFHVTKLVNGVKKVPAQVAQSAKMHSPFQWLHVRICINVCNDSANDRLRGHGESSALTTSRTNAGVQITSYEHQRTFPRRS